MNGEQKLLVAGSIVIGVGVLNAVNQQKVLTPVLLGGLTFVILLSLLAAFSTQAASLAGDLALLAAASSLLIELPGILNGVQKQTAALSTPPHQSNNPQ